MMLHAFTRFDWFVHIVATVTATAVGAAFTYAVLDAVLRN